MTLEAKGQIEIEKGKPFLDPKMELKKILQEWEGNSYILIVEIWESHFRHKFEFEFEKNKSSLVTKEEVLNHISKNEILNNFK